LNPNIPSDRLKDLLKGQVNATNFKLTCKMKI
jgi:hypothetical protein